MPRLKARCCRGALTQIAERMAPSVGSPSSDILDALLEREKLGSTAFGGGVAVPHARLETLDTMMGALAILDEPLDFDAVDGGPVDLVFVLLAPEEAGSEHLRALAKVARFFRDKGVCSGLRGAETVEAMAAVLTEHQASHAA